MRHSGELLALTLRKIISNRSLGYRATIVALAVESHCGGVATGLAGLAGDVVIPSAVFEPVDTDVLLLGETPPFVEVGAGVGVSGADAGGVEARRWEFAPFNLILCASGGSDALDAVETGEMARSSSAVVGTGD